jgi:EAL domain-containing protein (putative c-di-GMP-specific phosphodiesterase class I)
MPTSAPFAALHDYLQRLPDGPNPASSVWRTADGRAQGQFFDLALTSAFQPIYAVGPAAGVAAGRAPVGYEGLVRGVAPGEAGLSVWRTLDQAASDDESIELDRLCRMLHAINYFRQPVALQGADLYLSVHDRLLAAVSSNHGYAFLRILHALALPVDQIVLQLPAIGAASRWLANYVADNYRRNGFRLAFAATAIPDAIDILNRFQPHAIKLDMRAVEDPAALAQLLDLGRDARVKIIVKKVETSAAMILLERACGATGTVVHAQGDWLDAAKAVWPARALPAHATDYLTA